MGVGDGLGVDLGAPFEGIWPLGGGRFEGFFLFAMVPGAYRCPYRQQEDRRLQALEFRLPLARLGKPEACR